MIFIGLLFTLLNPSITEYDSAHFIDDIKPIQEVYEEEGSNLSPEEETFVESILMGHRRGDYNGHTADDIWWLYQCVEAEEGINSHRAKYLTACCILNRARMIGWGGSTITEVIFAKNQFEVVRNGRIYTVHPSEDTIRACNEALDECEEWVIAFAEGNLHKGWAELSEVHNGEYYYRQKD